MREPFPLSKLTPKQTNVVAELKRDHPQGVVLDYGGVPTFVSRTARESFEVDLVSLATRFSKLGPDQAP